MKRLYVVGVVGSLVLFAIALFKNGKSYSWKSAQWRWTKSGIDTALVLLAAFYMPALLVAWAVIWVTRGITRRSVQITSAVILGIAFGAVGGVALEVLCVLGIFSVDLLTGSQGIYGWWKKPIPKEFLPSLNSQQHEV